MLVGMSTDGLDFSLKILSSNNTGAGYLDRRVGSCAIPSSQRRSNDVLIPTIEGIFASTLMYSAVPYPSSLALRPLLLPFISVSAVCKPSTPANAEALALCEKSNQQKRENGLDG